MKLVSDERCGVLFFLLFTTCGLVEPLQAGCRLVSENTDYCGPANRPLVARMVPDEVFGPFRAACERHDYCYYAGGSQIVGQIEAHYRASMTSANREMKNEFSSSMSEVKRDCDQQFLGNLQQSCERSSNSFKCRTAAKSYYFAVKLAAGSAFDNSVDEAFRCRS